MHATCQQFEDAWTEYTDALDAHSRTEPTQFVRGHKRAHTVNRRRLARAKRTLIGLDPEWCKLQQITL